MRPSPLIGRASGGPEQYGINAPILFIPDIAYMKQEITGAGATTPAAVNYPVGSWLNIGTVGGWATSADTARRPWLDQNAGLKYLRADVTTDNQITLSTAQCNSFLGVDFCATFGVLAASNPLAYIGVGGTAAVSDSMGVNAGNAMRTYLSSTNISGGTVPTTNTVYVQNHYVQGGTVAMRTNGGLSTYSASSASKFSTGISMGIFSGSTAINNRFYALIIRTGTVSAAVRLADEQYIGSLCGVTI